MNQRKERVKSWLLSRCCSSLFDCDVAPSARPSPARSFKKRTHRRLKASFTHSIRPGPARPSARPSLARLSLPAPGLPGSLAPKNERTGA